jgi:sulfite exporter TauE/SafE
MHAENFMGAARSLDVLMLMGAGLAMSFGHCLGMCGPLVAGLAGAQRAGGLRVGRIATAHLVYHSGRIGSYALIGLLFASVGSALGLAAGSRELQGVLSLVVGALMCLLGVGLFGLLPVRSLLESRRLAGLVMRVTALLRQRRGAGSWFLLGVANGFLPCGPVYAVATGTVASRPLAGAAAMLLFGLGTVPALVAFALGAARISPAVQRRFNRLMAVLVLLIGLQLALRGTAALGWIGHLRFGSLVLY